MYVLKFFIFIERAQYLGILSETDVRYKFAESNIIKRENRLPQRIEQNSRIEMT